MKTRRPGDGSHELRDALVEAERLLEERADVARDGRTTPDADWTERVNRSLGGVERAAESDPVAAQRYARRLQRLRAHHALRTRQVPDGVLAGLYEEVRSRATEDAGGVTAWRRAEMSRAFLDAPRALTVWRRTAVAACALMALGVGFFLTRAPGGEGQPYSAGTPLEQFDPRDELLHRLGTSPGEASSRGAPFRNASPAPAPDSRHIFPKRWKPRSGDRGLLDAVRFQPPPAAARPNALEQN